MSSQMFPVFSVYYRKLKNRFNFRVDTARLSQLPWYFWLALCASLVPLAAGCAAVFKMLFMPVEGPVGDLQFVFTVPLILAGVTILLALLYFATKRTIIALAAALLASAVGAVATASILGVALS
jgi:hypothetical protein